jgi:hypothetical protein
MGREPREYTKGLGIKWTTSTQSGLNLAFQGKAVTSQDKVKSLPIKTHISPMAFSQLLPIPYIRLNKKLAGRFVKTSKRTCGVSTRNLGSISQTQRQDLIGSVHTQTPEDMSVKLP